MNITRAKGYVLNTVRASLHVDDDGLKSIDPRLQRPLFLVGPPGIGKTAIMAQVASELGIGLVSYSMTHHTRQSALGLPKIEHHEHHGYEYDATEYTMSEIIASLYDYMERTGLEQGILFLDEVNCVSETLYPSMLQFLQFKTFGAHSVPEGWIVACAGNPPEYNRSVHEFDIATLDRVRKIEVEPDYDAWKAYAADAGVHASVATFLETEKDCFYRVESTPGGKRFVTARGWDDLSRMITLNEELGMPVEQDLVEQFVQDNEIAERFALYYDLFRKYQSDYQIPSILKGTYGAEIVERAERARFDERLALMGLLLDALTPQTADLLVQEQALTDVRDFLREAKAGVLGGGNAIDAIQPQIDSRKRELGRLAESGIASADQARRAKRAIGMLTACRNACTLAGTEAGEEAFAAIHQEFRGFVGTFEAEVATLRDQLDNAYSFLEAAFGEGRETMLFTTELTARRATTTFVARYGCDAFSRHSKELQTVEKRNDLIARIDEARNAQAAPSTPDPVNADELAAYYEKACWEFGYASLCHMALPANLTGKTVLDIGCRRGKGVFKLSERVGAKGRAIGIDWVPDHIAQATERMERAARETGLPENNMEFHLAYPEDLMPLGLGDGTVDVAFINSILHLTCRPESVLEELYRVLKPGCLLICEVALATGKRDAAVVEVARQLGNSIQAAPCRADFEALLDKLGFDVEVAEEPHAVEASMGFKKGHEVPTAPSTETVAFEALVLHAVKR